MKLIRVSLGEKSYNIVVGYNIIASLGKHLKKADCGNSAIVVTNPVIKRLWGNKLLSLLGNAKIGATFLEAAGTEKSKSAETCFKLLDTIASLGRTKKIFVIAFGGGVVGDLGGFIASVYKRGVPYIQLPTTLLAQADSSIGGKVAIDLKAGKNLIGSFYQPRLVFSETKFLDTLPKKQIKNGLSEIIKSAAIKSPSLFRYMENSLEHILALDKKSIEHVVAASGQIKAKIVAQDEFDRLGVRAILNYGHTIGHAIEAAGGYSKRYTHGEAVSVGMIAANYISYKLGLISARTSLRIEFLLKEAGLPVRAKNVNPAKIYDAHLYDKKFANGKNRFVLLSSIGRAGLIENVPEKLIKETIKMICEIGGVQWK